MVSPPSGKRRQPFAPVSPSWFRTTSTLSSDEPLASLLHLASSHEVRRVFRLPAPALPKVRGTRSSSSRRDHPSKNSPHPQPSRVTAVVAFLPLPLGYGPHPTTLPSLPGVCDSEEPGSAKFPAHHRGPSPGVATSHDSSSRQSSDLTETERSPRCRASRSSGATSEEAALGAGELSLLDLPPETGGEPQANLGLHTSASEGCIQLRRVGSQHRCEQRLDWVVCAKRSDERAGTRIKVDPSRAGACASDRSALTSIRSSRLQGLAP
jgi:hypothetical protein